MGGNRYSVDCALALQCFQRIQNEGFEPDRVEMRVRHGSQDCVGRCKNGDFAER